MTAIFRPYRRGPAPTKLQLQHHRLLGPRHPPGGRISVLALLPGSPATADDRRQDPGRDQQQDQRPRFGHYGEGAIVVDHRPGHVMGRVDAPTIPGQIGQVAQATVVRQERVPVLAL